MMSEPLKLPEPWSWLITQEQPLHGATPMDGWGTPRLLFPVEQRPPVVVLPTGQDLLPIASFPFLLGENRVQAFHLPIDPRPRHDHEEFQLLDGMVELHQIHVVPRPRDKRGEQLSSQS